jgi:hypothetical protein
MNGHHNINVNAIAPGYMATNNTQALRDDAERNQEIVDRIPAGRWGKPDDLKGPAVFLASAASDYINGLYPRRGRWLAGALNVILVTKSYTVTSSAYCIKTLYCMHRQFSEFYHDGGRTPAFFHCLRGVCQKCRIDACAGTRGLVAYCSVSHSDLSSARY